MNVIKANGIDIHWREDGDPHGVPVVFANSLGTDLRLWDPVLPLLPPGFRYIRFDNRGHGLSSCPGDAYAMDDLVSDAEALVDALGLNNIIFVGLSIGGMIGQGLAAKRSDLIKALVLSNTGAIIGTPQMWGERLDIIREGGIAALADPILDRWFSATFRQKPEAALWRAMLTRTPVDGYLGCGTAIMNADLTETTRQIKKPTLCIVGTEDGATPPDVMRATADLIDGAAYAELEGAGHLPCVEMPEAYANLLGPFLTEYGHG